MVLRQCGLQRQLDPTSVAARLRGRPVCLSGSVAGLRSASGEGEQEASCPSSSSEPHRSGAGSAPPPAV
ncbi:hypothetical protein Taro_018769 [Colocasia esculenta]|uniref:Uncharacterized protein n=1 Tax=Colocasia esculenta TaxID=4460 RepID=A0A843V035_COLES|nr:hypothetical protein [Colocasia esculenta]